MAYRDHQPITLEEFKGLWQQGDPEEVPPDHFTECENVQALANGNIQTRYGIAPHQSVAVPLGNILRLYNYITQEKNTLLVLVEDTVDSLPGGSIYHVVDATTVYGPILSIQAMTDFGFASYGGRAYITPFGTDTTKTPPVSKGLNNQFLYVYAGDGTPARKAGGAGTTTQMTISNGAAGNTDAGFHLFATVFETASGYLTPPGGFTGFTTSTTSSVSFTNVPVSSDSAVTKRHIVATKVIENYGGNTTGYPYYFIPGATINDNVTTSLANISFFDADLLEDASYLLDNFTDIPAGVGLCLYHNRMCLYTTFNDISVIYVSAVGEPEAFNQVDGVLVVPPDGNPITNAQELRDVFYVMKRNKTVSFVDNEDIPSSWPMTTVDTGLGTSVHGIATVIDSGSSNVDYLIVGTARGITVFNGKYALPELSWKISNLWLTQDKNESRFIQILNDTVNQIIYCCLPDRRLLIGNYTNGLDPQNIRWFPWSFEVTINTIALVNTDELIIGAKEFMS